MKRQIGLSLQMIRKLHEGLHIPLAILLQDTSKKLSDNPRLPAKYPFAEMFKRGYFQFKGTLAEAKALGEELLDSFFSIMPSFELKPCYRQTQDVAVDENAIRAWQCRVFQRASQTELPVYDANRITDDFFNDVAKLSQYRHGPQNAMEKLHNAGIHLLYEPQLPKTRIDGAAFMLPDGHPVIAMTLRYDRLDNFWFTLMHELHHVRHDLSPDKLTMFVDDMENVSRDSKNEMEQMADEAAKNALIPPEVWKDEKIHALLFVRDSEVVRKVALEKQLSPAVLTGRLRWESKDYRYFQDLLGKCRDNLLETTDNSNETE
jgi:HTH-type transcriptional regulator/antitoxin HigA